MSQFQGRSFDTLVIPGKPIPEGYKIWVLTDQGYFLSWCFHRKGTLKDKAKGGGKKGPWRVKQLKELRENNSSAVVAHLMATLPRNRDDYIVYLDNLFTNVKLLRYRRARGWGVTGTYTAKSGILKQFCTMKEKDKKKDEIP